MKIAYSYQRFSSIKQKGGDSLTRQSNSVAAFCKQFNLTLADTFTDEGVSGFKGKNFSHDSALGAFLKLVEDGTVQKGACLIVENMDRLSRQSILPCMTKFMEIIGKGVSVGVISQGKILDERSITDNPMELMLVLVEFARANNESMAKSIRAKSAIAARIQRVKDGEKLYFGAQKPTWIIGMENGHFIFDNKRVKIVKDIFNLYLNGNSANKIADTLNQSKVTTLRGDKNGMWTNVTVAELLRNKNVYGWFGINGHEFDDYYPPIVSEKDYQLAQKKLEFNVKSRGGSKYGLVRNLFKGLLICETCGQTIETKMGSYRNVKGTLNHYADYICRGVKNKNGCTNKGRFNVSTFEVKMFQTALNPNDFNKQPKKDNHILDDLENKLAKVQMAISRFTKLLETDELANMQELSDNLTRLSKERDTLAKEIDAEKAKAVTISNAPKLLKLIKDEFKLHAKLEADGDLSLPVSKQRLKQEIKDIQTYLKSTETRKKLRNIMPSLLKVIRITFGNEPSAHYELINGLAGWTNLNVETGHAS